MANEGDKEDKYNRKVTSHCWHYDHNNPLIVYDQHPSLVTEASSRNTFGFQHLPSQRYNKAQLSEKTNKISNIQVFWYWQAFYLKDTFIWKILIAATDQLQFLHIPIRPKKPPYDIRWLCSFPLSTFTKICDIWTLTTMRAFLWSTSYLSHCHLFHKITSIVMDLRFTAEAGRTISELNISREEKGKILHKEKLTTTLIIERPLHHKSSNEISEIDKVIKLPISAVSSIFKLTKSCIWQWELEVLIRTDTYSAFLSQANNSSILLCCSPPDHVRSPASCLHFFSF